MKIQYGILKRIGHKIANTVTTAVTHPDTLLYSLAIKLDEKIDNATNLQYIYIMTLTKLIT